VILEGRLSVGDGTRFAVVAARFNELVSERLVAGAVRGLEEVGAPDPLVIWVPGALELAGTIQRLLDAGDAVRGVVAAGAVIRGATDHYEVVAREASAALARLGAQGRVPIANALLTVDSMEQALDRSGGKHGNKGYEAAMVVVRVAELWARLEATKWRE
jgi:6,7-dimethyl-8-ribityllumazine synthase